MNTLARNVPGANTPNITFSLQILTKPYLEKAKLVLPSRRQGRLHGLARAVLQSPLPATHWSAYLHAQTKPASSLPTDGWRDGSFVSWAGKICCSQLVVNTLWISQRCQCQSDARRVFSHQRRKTASHFWERVSISPPSLWQDLSLQTVSGPQSWERRWSLQWVPHTCRTGRGQKPDIIDCFLVSTLIRSLIHKCEVVKSVL